MLKRFTSRVSCVEDKFSKLSYLKVCASLLEFYYLKTVMLIFPKVYVNQLHY
jgi:hypothetical protein